jgi:HlyD family secretion protein
MNKKARILTITLVCAALVLGTLSGCTTQATSTQSQYTDFTVSAGELKNTLSLEGYLTPKQTVTVTAEENSKVAKIVKKKGYTVAKGAAVLTLENGNSVYAPARGKITAMKLAVGDWVDSTVTIGSMYDYSTATTTSSGMGKSTTTYESVNLTGAANSRVSKVDLADGATVAAGDVLVELENGNTIKAPIAGTVSSILVQAGDKVTPQTQIASIVDTSNFTIEVSVSEIDTQQLKVDQSVDVTINALNAHATGKVSDISVEGTVSNSTTNFTVKIQLDEQNASFRTNMSAQVNILVADVQNALSVPIDAVTTVNGKKIVMKKTDTAYSAQVVETGISNASYVQITKGLSEGDIVGVANSSGSNFNRNGVMGGFQQFTRDQNRQNQQGQPPQPPAGGN